MASPEHPEQKQEEKAMRTVTREPAILEQAHVWHYVDNDPSESPVDQGVAWHGVAAHTLGGLSTMSIAHPNPLPPATRYDLVPVDHPLPDGWRWAELAELEAVRATHPDAMASKDAAEQMIAALYEVFVVEVDERRGAGWLNGEAVR